MMRKLLPLSGFLLLAACQPQYVTACADESDTPSSAPSDSSDCTLDETASSVATPEEEPSATESASPTLDKSALNERKQPGKLLGYFAEAVNSGDWPAAALAWHSAEDGSPMTGPKLKALFGNPQEALISFGPGQQEGAAGSSFYEAPILLIAGGSQKEGTITLRRVNDVDGAEDWQLAWHVERLEWKK